MSLRSLFSLVLLLALGSWVAKAAGPDPAHVDLKTTKPLAWPGGVLPYDLSKLTEDQQATVHESMKRWEETGANLHFVQ